MRILSKAFLLVGVVTCFPSWSASLIKFSNGRIVAVEHTANTVSMWFADEGSETKKVAFTPKGYEIDDLVGFYYNGVGGSLALRLKTSRRYAVGILTLSPALDFFHPDVPIQLLHFPGIEKDDHVYLRSTFQNFTSPSEFGLVFTPGVNDEEPTVAIFNGWPGTPEAELNATVLGNFDISAKRDRIIAGTDAGYLALTKDGQGQAMLRMFSSNGMRVPYPDIKLFPRTELVQPESAEMTVLVSTSRIETTVRWMAEGNTVSEFTRRSQLRSGENMGEPSRIAVESFGQGRARNVLEIAGGFIAYQPSSIGKPNQNDEVLVQIGHPIGYPTAGDKAIVFAVRRGNFNDNPPAPLVYGCAPSVGLFRQVLAGLGSFTLLVR